MCLLLTRPATCSTRHLTMPILCTCVQDIHAPSLYSAHTYTLYLYSAVVVLPVVVVMVVVSQVTAQSSRKQRYSSEPHAVSSSSRTHARARNACVRLPYHSPPRGGQLLSTRQGGRLRHVFAGNQSPPPPDDSRDELFPFVHRRRNIAARTPWVADGC